MSDLSVKIQEKIKDLVEEFRLDLEDYAGDLIGIYGDEEICRLLDMYRKD